MFTCCQSPLIGVEAASPDRRCSGNFGANASVRQPSKAWHREYPQRWAPMQTSTCALSMPKRPKRASRSDTSHRYNRAA
jgi:hypothetical protein